MEAMEILGLIATIGVPLTGGLAWLFKLEGKAGVLDAQLKAESEMRKILEQRMNGFEGRIWEKLDNIEKLIHSKADK